jgi:acetyl/propionyl-CoA carboxylase alpha subunit
VLVANRGEIAVRVIWAAKDAGIPSVAVYAEPEADAPHVRLADEAFALGGQTSAESYLDIAQLLDAAAKSGATAVHPGYGSSRNCKLSSGVIDEDLIWIGRPEPAVDPQSRRRGDASAPPVRILTLEQIKRKFAHLKHAARDAEHGASRIRHRARARR